MKFEKNIPFNLPVLVTKGLVLFPGQSENVYIERDFTLNALNASQTTYESYILVVSQRDIDKNEINNIDEIYQIGTLCRISNINPIKDGYKAHINALERVSLANFSKLNDAIYCDAFLLEEVEGNPKEEEVIVAIHNGL